MLGTEPGSSSWVASALNHEVIFLAPKTWFLSFWNHVTLLNTALTPFRICAGMFNLCRLPGLSWERRYIFYGLEWCLSFKKLSLVLYIWDFFCMWKIHYSSSHYFKYLSYLSMKSQLLLKTRSLVVQMKWQTRGTFHKYVFNRKSFFMSSHFHIWAYVVAPCFLHLTYCAYSLVEFLHT